MNEMNNITTNIIDDMKVIDTEDKKVVVNLNQKLSAEDLMAIESIRKLKNPFRMVGVNTVMKDLNICKTVAYRLFQRDDFPSINIYNAVDSSIDCLTSS